MSLPSPRRRVLVALARFGLATPFVAVIAAGCGSRGPLDGTAPVDAGVEAAVEADIPDVGIDTGPLDAGVDAPPTPIDCALCIGQQCGPLILACLTDTQCRSIITCVAQKCFGGAAGGGGGGGGGGGTGGVDPVCLLTCASGQGQGAGKALEVVQCLTQTCGEKCGSILGGLGGLGGFGGEPPPPNGDLGARDEASRAAHRAALRQIFSPWPELSSSIDP